MSSRVERFNAAGTQWASTTLENGDVEIEPCGGQPILVVAERGGEARLECFRPRRQWKNVDDGIAIDLHIRRFPNVASALVIAARVINNDPGLVSDEAIAAVKRHAY